MIHVLLYPETLWEKINFQLRKIAPSIQCGTIRNGPGVVECVQSEDSCVMVPLDRIMQIVWDGGYKKAFEQSRNQYFQDMMESMKQMGVSPASPGQCGCDEEDDDCDGQAPYVASNKPVEGYN